DTPLQVRFGVEVCYGLDGGDSEFCYVQLANAERMPRQLGKTEAHDNISGYKIGTHIRGFEIEATVDKAAGLWHFTLQRVTISEGGFDKIHQGALFLHLWELDLAPAVSWQTRFAFTIRDSSTGTEAAMP